MSGTTDQTKPESPRPDTGGAGDLADRIATVPLAPDAERAQLFLKDLLDHPAAGTELSALMSRTPDLEGFLLGIIGNSPYLRDLMLTDPARLVAILSDAPESRLSRILAEAEAARAEDEADIMKVLRLLKQDLALTLGLADIAGAIGLNRVTHALAGFADASLTAAIRFCLDDLTRRNRFQPKDPERPEIGSGLIVLAMGKHGANELNYSSDIDLIVLYDPAIAPMAGSAEAPVEFVRLTRRLVKIMQDRTADGYVFRTDLRLRPDPGATPLAMSVPAALVYYESLGQNWERAALIKARACAGDIEAGNAFLHEIGPFIWRKYLDFAAIADVQSIKRQIHMHKGHSVIAVAGHNVKLGRGGIREVEFFVQTQQLIAGGRNPALRGRRTLDMLDGLLDADWIRPRARDELSEAYRFLRTVEHRIQMLNDEQTQLLPKDEDGLMRVAALMGYDTLKAFEAVYMTHLKNVQSHYADLFEDEPGLSSDLGNLVFTGDDHDPDTLETLARLGFKQPGDAAAIVKSWHFGRYPSTRSTKAREILTEMHPALIGALAATDNADAALRAFDAFLAKLPAGVQLFSLLRSNPHLLTLLATAMGAAPRMADTVSKRVHVLDAVLDPAFFGAMPSVREFRVGLDRTLSQARFYEEALDRARIFTQEQQFLIGLRLISDTLSSGRVGYALARLAEVVVERILSQVIAHVGETHGVVPGGNVAVLAMGKLGGREMTAASDLDLILLYEAPEDVKQSDGRRPMPVSQYYTRLTQRLVTALSAPTAEGTLYEVDFRLRPSGNAGPLATNLDGFIAYQKNDAWTWEHMALTRARVIAASSPEFSEKIRHSICHTLTSQRDRPVLADDVRSMRAKIEKEKGTKDIWDLKQVAGGLVDIEFIAQFLLLANGRGHPEIITQATDDALTILRESGFLSVGDAEVLLEALGLYQRLTQVLRMALDGKFEPRDAPGGVLDLLVQASGSPTFSRLEADLADRQRQVRTVFERLVGPVETVDTSRD
ncbi:bifunctional [glutamine synthetase] adenylyltransferase/[glutamine synthetase]-adenylyl-L-tyrosine phosphorylase [Roseibium denhamense]|uniref:Bifunctional glutamine synthetase adenylyltransferase/adenylyl-removing enzyme n=1 Tax=Roseibium denhamense TaxID=76305 RepID=A0ABY1PR20_9HYPH|nr:bifunctional [glutamine synthetase] adenylyltransferase/[glutamine synthetase]-adenylyl-L-tyrosine phosphorylase [Roseibium denhamense]MTI05751.1 bifunctional [glutamine synthetase] adenylyltransferase/[glutamine synthetase]-adenylyl-L-tyrosine phosphorylase [Roseibium denhamense]SMP36983.1 glutamate-ammonia-ligase adenylyltransferase [Roseibium denhamense]